VPIALRRWAADSDWGEVIGSDATMALRFQPALAQGLARLKENVHHGISLRNLR